MVVRQVSRHCSSSPRILSSGPTRATSSTIRNGHRGDGVGLVAGQVQLLDPGGLGLVAHAGEHVEVEVGPLGAHAPGVQREERPHHVGALLHVVARHDDERGGHLEVVGRAPGPWPGEPLREAGPVEGVVLRGEEQGQPAVAQLGRQGDVLRPLGREVDRQVLPERVDRALQRLADAHAAAARHLVLLALVLDRLLPGDDLPHDRDVLPCPGERLRVRLPVPPLDDLRARCAQAEDEAAPGEVVHRHGRHRRRRRGAGRELHDGGPELHVGGVRPPPRQRRRARRTRRPRRSRPSRSRAGRPPSPTPVRPRADLLPSTPCSAPASWPRTLVRGLLRPLRLCGLRPPRCVVAGLGNSAHFAARRCHSTALRR